LGNLRGGSKRTFINDTKILTITKITIMNIQHEIQNLIDNMANNVENTSSAKLSVCDERNWDKNLWEYRHQIMDALRARGYIVNSSTNYGVLDIVVTKKLNLS